MRIFLKKEDGNAFLLMALGMMLALGMLGLVVDAGHLYMTKSHMQKTANAAALSGAQELPNSGEKVNQVVGEILTHHGESDSLLFSNIEGESQLHVGVGRDVPLFFSSLFGVDSVMIGADAKAGLHAMTAGFGTVPLGLNESMALVYGQTYTLKVDAGDSEMGNFGILALEGPGAKSYGESLKHGFDEKLKVGDVVNTQTGNIAGATREGVNYRINNCPYPDGDYQQRDCSRIMLIPVYKPLGGDGKQVKSVEITGFAYFYLAKPMDSKDDSISGIFIKRVGAGESDSDAPLDRGAYTIKLTR
ncbi:TadE/TadG family type IV pilus assembly protein [Salinicoccus halitifaciens]|uniref:Putative Flp pilus-assembly TadG-like N-terminal domain-containing protein n=1 Tax=Salinicoccus halitifaciens TaxID=1073415 RepID=A0ABV2E9N6_9STAP|nr:TadE/TadG family type IV pilus assembly protein [Salinicoccus halitifaciens]MCD2137994.1 Tad domain-containing protein [Salinicoccus halitifaciens]